MVLQEPDPKNKQLFIRITESEWDSVVSESNEKGITKSEVVRSRIRNGPAPNMNDIGIVIPIRTISAILGLLQDIDSRLSSLQGHSND